MGSEMCIRDRSLDRIFNVCDLCGRESCTAVHIGWMVGCMVADMRRVVVAQLMRMMVETGMMTTQLVADREAGARKVMEVTSGVCVRSTVVWSTVLTTRSLVKQEAFEKCWAHSLLRAASRQFTRCRQRYCRVLPAHQCPQRQRVTGDRYGPMEWAQLFQ